MLVQKYLISFAIADRHDKGTAYCNYGGTNKEAYTTNRLVCHKTSLLDLHGRLLPAIYAEPRF